MTLIHGRHHGESMASDALSNDLGNGASGLPKGTVVHAKMGRLTVDRARQPSIHYLHLIHGQ